MTDDTVTEFPKRGRPPRQEVEKKARRRRSDLGMGRNLKLFIPEEAKDPNYVYRFVNDAVGADRVRRLTVQDDWDVVNVEDLRGGFGVLKEGEQNGPYKVPVGMGADGNGMYAYLIRKLKSYFEADKAEEQRLIDEHEKAVLSKDRKDSGALGKDDGAYTPSRP